MAGKRKGHSGFLIITSRGTYLDAADAEYARAVRKMRSTTEEEHVKRAVFTLSRLWGAW